LRRAAHTLKGSARLFSAHPVGDAAQELESCARDGLGEDATSLLAQVTARLNTLTEQIQQRLG